jgi:hypothetical protein
MDELKEAIKAINTGKSEDIYGLSIENIIFAGEEILHHLLDVFPLLSAVYELICFVLWLF